MGQKRTCDGLVGKSAFDPKRPLGELFLSSQFELHPKPYRGGAYPSELVTTPPSPFFMPSSQHLFTIRASRPWNSPEAKP